mmetsp:Transcript_15606/g.18138  ORF Transcript_15606/g.18138 Transcript_15606/m.18138 type:complete len:531 (-) Transcript_15606:112-1704(-)
MASKRSCLRQSQTYLILLIVLGLHFNLKDTHSLQYPLSHRLLQLKSKIPSTSKHHDRTSTTKQFSTILKSSSSSSPNDEAPERIESSSSCPFSMKFPRYRIPVSGGKDKPNKSNNIFSGLFTSMQKSEFERKFSKNVNKKEDLIWFDAKKTILESSSSSSGSGSSAVSENEDDERIKKGKIGIHVSAFVWRTLSNLIQETMKQEPQQHDQKVIIGLPNASFIGLKQLADIISWMEEESINYNSKSSKHNSRNLIIHASVEEDSPIPTIILSVTCAKQQTDSDGNLNDDEDAIRLKNHHNEYIVKERTKSWVERILVKMGICPFTKSVTKSGHGLGDVGVPVGKIAYHYSNALDFQIATLMADTWEAISNMIQAGPSGKDGISSILLAAPEFDHNFSFWAGPIFAILEANVGAASAEPIIGVVCFHPQYKTPDGSSFPGFGHMHSSPRLSKWVKDNDVELFDKLEMKDVSAGGAFQRRTPHATINILRAEQLEAAEGRRSTGSLYSTNIRTLFEVGFDKLDEDLKKEQQLV